MSVVASECAILGHEFCVDHENDPPTCIYCGGVDPAWQDRQADRLTKGWRDYRTETWASKDIEEVGRILQAAQYELEAFDASDVSESVIAMLAKARAILRYSGEHTDHWDGQ